MPLSVSIFFADNTPMTAGVAMQLLSAGAPVDAATVGPAGVVIFANTNPATLTAPVVRLNPIQPTPPSVARQS